MCSIITPLLANFVSQISHLNGFFPSWNDDMWSFRQCFEVYLASQIVHLNFFPSWRDSIWFFNVPFWEKADLHSLHKCVFLPSWTDFIWVDISEWVENALLQTWHSKSLFFSWTADTWRFRLENVVKLEGHKLQLNGFLPSWTDWICFRKLLSLAHFLSQIEHSNFFPSWTVLMCLFKVPFSEKADLQSLHECDLF